MNPLPRGQSPTVLCAGRAGDILASLPIAREISFATDNVVEWIASNDYAPILRCATYARAVPYDGHFGNVGAALKKFQHRHPSIVIAQAWSRDGCFPPPQQDNFVEEAWARAGKLEHFGLPLDIDARSSEREAALVKSCGLNGQPTLLVSASGFSCPYPYRAQLTQQLQALKKDYHIVDISDLRCDHISDLLGLMDRATAALLVDSAPLHLSYASPDLKVFALTADNPNNWFGSPRRPNWINSCRYSESLARMPDIVEQLRSVAGPRVPSRIQIKGLLPGGYNPSLIRWEGKLLCIYRYHPARNWVTKLRVAELNEKYEALNDLPVHIPDSRDDYSNEDARFFVHNGKLNISYTLATWPPKAVVGYGELEHHGNHWDVPMHNQVEYGHNDWSGLEKNHIFFTKGDALFCIYQVSPEQIVLQIEGDKVVSEWRTKSPHWPFGQMRGDSAPLPWDEKHDLRFFHSCARYPSGKFRYHVAALLQDREPPFQIRAVTRGPLFSGQPKLVTDRHHRKPNVVFGGSAIQDVNGIFLALGTGDEQAHAQTVQKTQLMFRT